MEYFFRKLLQKDGWCNNVKVSVQEGLISAIEPDHQHTQNDWVGVPGFQNAHSHAFQYAMAGLAERHPAGSSPDDFWSWRKHMYALAQKLNPEHLEHIATMLYSEMLRHGYTNVAEFHYLHHDVGGHAYAHLAEMGSRLISAAKTAGIGITLCPVFYQKGGFEKSASAEQRRFLSANADDYMRLLEASIAACNSYECANGAMGIHSLRAVAPDQVKLLAREGFKKIPFHLHVSEQQKEVEEARHYLKQRPVEWLLENIEVNSRHHLVHATHLNTYEVEGIARSGAHVVLCPSTEGNLGDGLFPLQIYQSAGGQWSIGTDSHVSLSPLEELRLLDYGQRLTTHKRNIFTSDHCADAGTYALNMSTFAGRAAMGHFGNNFFEVGQPFNCCVMDGQHPLLNLCSDEHLSSTIVYAMDAASIIGTISHGKMVVSHQIHKDQDAIRSDFAATMKGLLYR